MPAKTRPLIRFTTRLILFAAALVSVACAIPGRKTTRHISKALASPPSSGWAASMELQLRAAPPGTSGIAVINSNIDAFNDRLLLASRATQTLDIQYFLWTPDTIGLLLSDAVLTAARRGVRVRFLIDDLNPTFSDRTLAAMAAHPNVEIRLFNPQGWRRLRKLDFILDFARLNYRMHNKMFIMDNACAVIGGRNIADEYFGLHKSHNMRDLDLFAAGPVVRDASRVFDDYWNSAVAVPVEGLTRSRADLASLQSQTDALKARLASQKSPFLPRESSLAARQRAIPKDLVFSRCEVLYDNIASFRSRNHDGTLVKRLEQELATARQSLEIEAAYFVMSKRDAAITDTLLNKQVNVRVVTNSLASTNQPAAHSGHANRRHDLLLSGATLYELRPDAAVARADHAPGRESSLTGIHTKALVIDERKAFVGSFNLDPRSANINTEVGLLIANPIIARRVSNFLDTATLPENSWRVTLNPHHHLEWAPPVAHHEPATTRWQRFKCRIYRLLPIESLL
jgi:cardiolipin synthase C